VRNQTTLLPVQHDEELDPLVTELARQAAPPVRAVVTDPPPADRPDRLGRIAGRANEARVAGQPADRVVADHLGAGAGLLDLRPPEVGGGEEPNRPEG